MNLHATLRTYEDELAYTMAKVYGELKRLHDEPAVHEFIHWRIIKNRFPYTVAYRQHDLLLPKRLVADEEELTIEELQEFRAIKKDFVRGQYDQILENLGKTRSVLDHYHVHLVTYYDSREEMKL